MGFKNVEWAYSLDLPMREKVVLAALCFCANDKTYETIVGQQTLAKMTGASGDTVRRALNELDDAGVISRERRHSKGGWRTSDRTFINVETYTADSKVGEEAYPAHSANLTSNQLEPNQQPAVTYPADSGANRQEGEQEGQQEGEQEDTRETKFTDFYAIWPRKVNKPKAEIAWAKAIKRATSENIIDAAIAYRDNPGIPAKTFIPYPATWLNADGWNDDLPDSRSNSTQSPDERARETLAAGQRLIASRQGPTASVTTLRMPNEISA